jgi:predicted neuraminidase
MNRRLTITLRLPTLLLVGGLVAAAWRAPKAPPAQFVVPPEMTATERPKLPIDMFAWRRIPQDAPSAHASSLAMAPDGSLLMAWFAGEREGARDVAIQMARLPRSVFGAPWRADGFHAPSEDSNASPAEYWVSLTREQLQALTSRVIRKIGNPVLWFDGKGRLHMDVVSVSYGGWSGSAINQLVSDDEGRTWSSAKRLILSPFFNLSTLVRTQPQILQDGSVGLPAYHEFVQKWGLWVRLDADGALLQSVPMQRYEGNWLQPAVVATSPTEAVAALRAGSHAPRVVGRSATSDGGRTWPLNPSDSTIDIPNPDSSMAMIRLSDGSLLMACNPLEQGRNRLQLFHSEDGGSKWKPSRLIEASDGGDEFSYPALVQDRDGRIHLSYTWKRQAICLCTFSPEWLDQPAPDDAPAVRRDSAQAADAASSSKAAASSQGATP